MDEDDVVKGRVVQGQKWLQVMWLKIVNRGHVNCMQKTRVDCAGWRCSWKAAMCVCVTGDT